MQINPHCPERVHKTSREVISTSDINMVENQSDEEDSGPSPLKIVRQRSAPADQNLGSAANTSVPEQEDESHYRLAQRVVDGYSHYKQSHFLFRFGLETVETLTRPVISRVINDNTISVYATRVDSKLTDSFIKPVATVYSRVAKTGGAVLTSVQGVVSRLNKPVAEHVGSQQSPAMNSTVGNLIKSASSELLLLLENISSTRLRRESNAGPSPRVSTSSFHTVVEVTSSRVSETASMVRRSLSGTNIASVRVPSMVHSFSHMVLGVLGSKSEEKDTKNQRSVSCDETPLFVETFMPQMTEPDTTQKEAMREQESRKTLVNPDDRPRRKSSGCENRVLHNWYLEVPHICENFHTIECQEDEHMSVSSGFDCIRQCLDAQTGLDAIPSSFVFPLFDPRLHVITAFRAMAEHRLTAVAVGTFGDEGSPSSLFGIITISDCVRFICSLHEMNGEVPSVDDISEYRIADMTTFACCSNIMRFCEPLPSSTSLTAIVGDILHGSRSCIPIGNDTACPGPVVHLLSLVSIVRFLVCSMELHCADLANPISYMKKLIRSDDIAISKVTLETEIMTAMETMALHGMQCLPIVDDNDAVQDVLTFEDLLGMSSGDTFQDLRSPLSSIIQRTNPRQAVHLNSSIGWVLDHMAEHQADAMVVVDENRKAIGFIFLSDLMFKIIHAEFP